MHRSVYIVDPNDKYEDRFEEAQAEAQAVPRGIWALSIAEQAQLTDRNNGIGTGDGCQPMAAPPPPPPAPSPAPSPAPNPAPSPAPSPARTPDIPSAPSAPAGRSGLTCADFSTEAEASAAILSNPQLDRDKDGRACETLP
jgi:hypothetical protein